MERRRFIQQAGSLGFASLLPPGVPAAYAFPSDSNTASTQTETPNPDHAPLQRVGEDLYGPPCLGTIGSTARAFPYAVTRRTMSSLNGGSSKVTNRPPRIGSRGEYSPAIGE